MVENISLYLSNITIKFIGEGPARGNKNSHKHRNLKPRDK